MGTRPSALDVAVLAPLRDLLARHPGSAVAVFDPAKNLIDAGPLLGRMALPTDDYVGIRCGAAVELVHVSDAWLVSEIAAEAEATGHGWRRVRLPDGGPGELHIVTVDDVEPVTAVVIVPHNPGPATGRPAPTAAEASPLAAHLRFDGFGVVIGASNTAPAMLGIPEGHLLGMGALTLLPEDEHEAAIVNWVAGKEHRGVSLRWRTRVRRGKASTFWADLTLTNAIDADGNGEVRLDLFDVSREVAVTEALAAERELLRVLAEMLPVGVARFDTTGDVQYVNERLIDMLAPHDAADVLRAAMAGTLDDAALPSAFTDLLGSGTATKVVVAHQTGVGVPRHLEWTLRPVLGGGGEVVGGVVCVDDVTDAVTMQRALEQRAITDPLTGCLNRAGVLSRLDEEIDRAGPTVALLFIDLNGFKEVNDSYGHAMGDELLIAFSARLRGAVRGSDLVGRLGGDEFVVLAPNLTTEDEAMAVAHRVATRLRGPVEIDGLRLDVAASIGVSWARDSGASLLSAADEAMYVAKKSRSASPVLAA